MTTETSKTAQPAVAETATKLETGPATVTATTEATTTDTKDDVTG